MDELKKISNKLKKTYLTARIASEEEDTKDYMSTGNLSLDLCLEGGIAVGYVTELVGGSQSCKTTIEQILLGDFQKKYNGIGIWIDRENAWVNERAAFLGVDLDKVIVLGPLDVPTVSHAIQASEDILPGFVDTPVFFGLDSVAAFDDGFSADKANVGGNSKQFHRLFRRITGLLNKRSSIVFSNHRTFKIGVMFGNPESSHGGEGPKFYSSYRIKLDSSKAITDDLRGGENIGNWIKAVVLKTRRGPSFRNCCFKHIYDTGIPYYSGYDRLLVDRNYLQPSNIKEFESFKQDTVKYKGERLGKVSVEELVEKFPELLFDKYPEYNIEEIKEEEIKDES